MRYPEAKIKDAILDPDIEIRSRATEILRQVVFPRPLHHAFGHQGRGNVWQERRDLPACRGSEKTCTPKTRFAG